MIATHHWWRTWLNQIDTFIAPSECVRTKLIEGGLPADKIVLKPNFVDPDPGYQHTRGSGYALFAGRLSREKGVELLISTWQHVSALPLLIVGDGPEAPRIRDLIETKGITNVKMLGSRCRADLFTILKEASFLIFPSQWPEAFGLMVVEAFACGVPVIASRVGALPELIRDGETGLLFNPDSPTDLSDKVEWTIRNPEEAEIIRKAARREYERRYTGAVNYPLLCDIYDRTIRAFSDIAANHSSGSQVSAARPYGTVKAH